jgi:hypothetical protein
LEEPLRVGLIRLSIAAVCGGFFSYFETEMSEF